MIVPAIVYKDEIEDQFKRLLYTEKLMWYDGGIDVYDHEVITADSKYQFAIINKYQVVIGYITFRVDFYTSQVYNFGLIKFLDNYKDFDDIDTNGEPIVKSTSPLITSALHSIIKMIESFNPHRIDFRCVADNPIRVKYNKIVLRFINKYDLHLATFHDSVRDRQGKYHSMVMYELIRHS